MFNSVDSYDVSIIIVSWNTCDILRECLQSVCTETSKITFELIVVDNGSTDGSDSMVRQEFPNATLLVNSNNRGFAAANNQGIAIAKGRYLLLLNSDTIILDHAVEKTIKFADAHPDAAVIGCRLLNPDGTLQNSCFMFPSLLNLFLLSTGASHYFPKSRLFGRERMTWWDRSDDRQVDVVTGCFMLVRKEAVKEVGQMDERFFMYNEETDWCYRFKTKGWENWFMAGAEIVHIGGASAAKLGPRRATLENSSCLQYMFKHWPAPKAFVGLFLLSLFFVLRLPIVILIYFVGHRENDKKMVEHFWTGLKVCTTFFSSRIRI